MNQNKPNFYFYKASVLIRLEKYEETIPVLNKVIELDLKNHAAFGELGKTML